MWASSIVAFAVLATVFVLAGVRAHGAWYAAAVALTGTAIIGWTMFVHYNVVTEIIGFVLLAVASVVDYRLRRWSRVSGGKKGALER